MLTIDASVLVAAFLDDEDAHADAVDLLRAVGRSGARLHQPAMTVVEVAAAIARRTGRPELAEVAERTLLELPGAAFHTLDLPAALTAAGYAAVLGLRAGDALYAAVAHGSSSTLVTLDVDLRERARAVMDACTPVEWLER